jgi:ABC-type multidrug transport system fused ATPase/permease subunit
MTKVETAERDEVSFTGKYSQSVWNTLRMAMKPFQQQFVFFVMLGFLGRALFLFNANLIGIFVDSLCLSQNSCVEKTTPFLKFLSQHFFFILLLCCCLGLIFSLFFRIFVARMGTFGSSLFYDETTLRVSRFAMSFFDAHPVGRMMTRFSSDYAALTRMSGGPLSELLSLIFDLILIFIFTAVASVFFLPVLLLAVVVNFVVYSFNKSNMRKQRRLLGVQRGPAVAHFAETIQGARVIRIFEKKQSFLKSFLLKLNVFVKQKNKTNTVVSFFSFQMAFVNMVFFLCSGFWGVWLVREGLLTLGSLGVAFTFLLMSTATIQVFFEWIAVFEEALTGAERMDHYLQLELEPGAELPSCTKFQTKQKILSLQEANEIEHSNVFQVTSAELCVENLTLRYASFLEPALKNVSFQVKPGEKVGIIGKTGSGKSSLIQALFHLYPFESGRIFINGYEANLFSPDSAQIFYPQNPRRCVSLSLFRSALSLMTQDSTLFSGTLRENLSCSQNLSDEEMIFVGNLVGLKRFFSKRKNPLDFEIQEKAANLSAGEKQLVCLARCLLQKAPIVFMDEPTSSVDPFLEELFLHATKNYLKGKTQIVVAHRLSSILDCQRLIWLDFGRIMMEGPVDTVLKSFQSLGSKPMKEQT